VRSSARPGLRTERLAFGALLAAGLLPLVWPGDAPFINDEPLLIESALHANAALHLADRGLLGTFGVAYGPLPTWVYQVLTGITHDLVVVVALHAALMAAVTALALWWLGRSLRLPLWFAPVPLVSPYFWFYARVLLDNPFLIPLGTLALAGYAAHLVTGSRTGLRVSLAAALSMTLVHLMSVAFLAPLLGHMLIVRRRELWAERIPVAVTIVVLGVLAWPYWNYLLHARLPPGGGSRAEGWLFPLWGGRLFSARALDYFYGSAPVSGRVLQIASNISALAFALVWMGIGVALCRTGVAKVRGQWSARAHLSAILLLTVACQSVLDGLSGKFEHPQYYNATWAVFALLSWFAIDWLASATRTRWLATAAAGLLAAALLTTVGTLGVRLHRTSGTRTIYGPTIANQQDVARELGRYSPRTPLTVSVTPYQTYPHALAILRELNTPRYARGPATPLEVRYASSDPASGAIELVER
jgi:hypothetical protein